MTTPLTDRKRANYEKRKLLTVSRRCQVVSLRTYLEAIDFSKLPEDSVYYLERTLECLDDAYKTSLSNKAYHANMDRARANLLAIFGMRTPRK